MNTFAFHPLYVGNKIDLCLQAYLNNDRRLQSFAHIHVGMNANLGYTCLHVHSHLQRPGMRMQKGVRASMYVNLQVCRCDWACVDTCVLLIIR